MTPPAHQDDPGTAPPATGVSGGATRGKALVVLVVAAVFVALFAIRLSQGMQGAQPSSSSVGGPVAEDGPDPAASFEEALGAGRPIYVLFHSATCAPCVEIDAVASRVVPEYEGRVSFVDVYTDDPRARPLFARFAFQYIPTSFFLAADGAVVDQYTGVLNDDEMRSRLETLLRAGSGG